MDSTAAEASISATMSSTRDQIYKPLRTEAHQIRLCSILPASFDDPIQCVLKIASLDEQPPYEALSYVWGDPSDCLPITVDSRNLPVTKNLECAMRYLRSSEKTRWVWIDALCINQDSIPERNAQVQLMHRIYSGAVLVVSWLGMEMAVHLKTAAEMIQYCREFPAALSNTHETGQSVLSYTADTVGLCLARKPVVDDTYCEYWFRAWISQEVASAKRVILKSSHSELPMESIEEFAESVYNFEQLSASAGFDHCVTLQPRIAPGTATSRPLLAILRSRRQSLCSNPLDKIYSFLNMSIFAQNSILIDYSRPVRDVYTSVIENIITSTSSLNAICEACLDYSSTTYGLPSWVPDWSFSVGRLNLVTPTSKCKAGGSKPRISFLNRDGQRLLLAEGFQVGRIGAVSGIPYQPGNDMRARRAIQMLAKPYQELRKLTNFSPLATNVVETYIFGLSWAFDISLKDINALVCRELPELAGGPEAFYDEQISSSEPLKDGLHYIKTLEEAGGDSSRVFFAFWNAVGFPTLDSYQWYHKLTALGLGPKGLRAGDMVVVLFGCDNPVVLRRIENNFRLVGAVYIQRISEGQAMEDLTDGGYERQTFEIQ